jgi:anti-sigma-K factor RskA
MIDEVKQELLVQYLLNEVDAATAGRIRAELETNAELRKFLRETEDAFASIAHAAPPMAPPVGLAERILHLERNVSSVQSTPPRSKIIWLVLPWAIAACLAVGCIVLGLERTGLEKENILAGQELLALRQKVVRVEESLAASQRKNLLAEVTIATLKAQVASYETASAVVVWDNDQKNGVLQLDKLPPAATGKDYQLWVIDPKIAQPVSAGVVAIPNNGLIRASFHPVSPVDSAAAFAITLEKAGGVSKAEGPVIFVGK